MLLPVIFFDCLPICILSVVQFLVLESIYGASLHYLPSCSQINQHKHFNYSVGNTATPAYSGATRPLDVVWNRTTHEIPSVSLHLRIGINGFLFSNGFIGVIAYSYLPDLLIAILDAHLFLNHRLAFTHSATHQLTRTDYT